MTRDYTFFAGWRIAWRDSSGNVYYYFADVLGSTRVVTNATGSRVPRPSESHNSQLDSTRALLGAPPFGVKGGAFDFSCQQRGVRCGR